MMSQEIQRAELDRIISDSTVPSYLKGRKILSELLTLSEKLSAELIAAYRSTSVDHWTRRDNVRSEDLWLLALGIAVSSTDQRRWLAESLRDLIPQQWCNLELRSFLLSICRYNHPEWSRIPRKLQSDQVLASLLGDCKFFKEEVKILRVFHYSRVRKVSRKRGYTDGKSGNLDFSWDRQLASKEFLSDYSSREMQLEQDNRRTCLRLLELQLSLSWKLNS